MQVEPIMRLPKVLESRGIGRSTHYSEIPKGLMTAPVKIGKQAVGWPASEIDALNRARVAGRTEDEIRALVQELMKRREFA